MDFHDSLKLCKTFENLLKTEEKLFIQIQTGKHKNKEITLNLTTGKTVTPETQDLHDNWFILTFLKTEAE